MVASLDLLYLASVSAYPDLPSLRGGDSSSLGVAGVREAMAGWVLLLLLLQLLLVLRREREEEDEEEEFECKRLYLPLIVSIIIIIIIIVNSSRFTI